MNNSPFGGPSYPNVPGGYQFDQKTSVDDISAQTPQRSSGIDVGAEARAMGVGKQTGVGTDDALAKMFGATASVNLMDVLSGRINLTLDKNLPGSEITGATGTAAPTPSTTPSAPVTPAPPTPGIPASLVVTLSAEIAKLKNALKGQETVNEMQRDQINMAQDAINKILMQDKNRFSESMTETVSSQNFFFDLRKAQAFSAPEWS
jgi:hypothetical protein